MARPQIKQGYTRVANEILEEIAKTNLSAYESRVLWAVIRLTYGWHKKRARISLGQLEELTKMPRKKISVILKRLSKRLILVIERPKRCLYISFQKDYELWKRHRKISYKRHQSFEGLLCPICGQKDKEIKHHILPRSWGGEDCKENLIEICYPCHIRIHIWLRFTNFTNAQDVYDKFWKELGCPLFGGYFRVELSPEQESKLSLPEMSILSPVWGIHKRNKERKEKSFISHRVQKKISSEEFERRRQEQLEQLKADR